MKIGLIGSGFMGKVHAAAWAQTPAALAGVLSSDPEGAASLAAEYGATVYGSLGAMLSDVDVVDICAPTHLHKDFALEAAAAGKHIVCEKPLARTVADAQAMIAACEQAGVMLLVAHVVRFFPEYASAKSIVDRGEIGRVGVTRLTRCSFKPARNDPSSWFHDTAKSGGMMFDLMIHDFDYARWVSGDVTTVYAKHVIDRFPDAPGDYALAILKHASGAMSHVEGGWAYPVPMFRTALEIAGDRGLIEHPAASSVAVNIYQHETSSADVTIAVPRNPVLEDPYTTQIKHFYGVLTGAITEPRVTAQDGAAAVEIALAAIESAQTGRPVHLKAVAR
jgi:predicted dehydrogenase